MPNYEWDTEDSEDSLKIRHVVKGIFKHDTSYRVYVTQIDKEGYESPKSECSVVRVGDSVPPPVPTLSLDTSEYDTGCHAVDNTCDVYLEWDTPDCDDLSRYQLFVWRKKPDWYTADGKYKSTLANTADSEVFVGSAENSTAIDGCYAGRDAYFGIQAVDTSRNTSDLYVIKVHVVDSEAVDSPKSNNITVKPQGIWAIQVDIQCPSDMQNVKAVEIYRDGQTKIASLIFLSGKSIRWVDSVDYSIGIKHYYTYKYITYDGRESQMSQPSLPATADVIDMKYIDESALKTFLDAWSEDGLKGLDELEGKVNSFKKTNDSLEKELKKVKDNYKEVYDKYTRLVNEFKQISATSTQQDSTIKSMRTTITQNSNAVKLRAEQSEVDAVTKKATNRIDNWLSVNSKSIESYSSRVTTAEGKIDTANKAPAELKKLYETRIKQDSESIKLKASKSDIDKTMGEVRKQVTAELQVNTDSINTVVANKKKNCNSSLTQLKNAIALRVSRSNIGSEIDLAIQDGISTGVIKADRVVINGECLLQGNARLVGRFSANTFEITDPKTGKPIWNSDVGTIKPFKVEETHAKWPSDTFPHGWPLGPNGSHWRVVDYINFTPQPPVIFNGDTVASIHVEGVLAIAGIIKTEITDPVAYIYKFETNGAVPDGANNNTNGANIDWTPIAIVDSRGCCSYIRPNEYGKGKGWEDRTYYKETKYNANNHWYKTTFSFSWKENMPIGVPATVGFAIVRGDITRFEVRTFGYRDIKWRITAS